MTNKTVLITGTSSGLGLSIAINLAEQGFKVFATMRNLQKAEPLKQAAANKALNIHLLELDVQSQASVDRAVAHIIEQTGRLDILINNAGAGFIKTTEQATEDEINWVNDVNYMGVVRTTKAVLPHMRQARSGHIINISSVGGLVGQPFHEFYCAAKFAVEGYTEALASYIQPKFGVKFSLVEPGGIQSEFAASVLRQIDSSGGLADDEYQPIFQQYIGNAQARAGQDLYQSADDVAKVVSDVVNNPEPPIRTRTSAWSETFSALKTQADPSGLKQQQMIINNML